MPSDSLLYRNPRVCRLPVLPVPRTGAHEPLFRQTSAVAFNSDVYVALATASPVIALAAVVALSDLGNWLAQQPDRPSARVGMFVLAGWGLALVDVAGQSAVLAGALLSLLHRSAFHYLGVLVAFEPIGVVLLGALAWCTMTARYYAAREQMETQAAAKDSGGQAAGAARATAAERKRVLRRVLARGR
jgi:hypothetical protein